MNVLFVCVHNAGRSQMAEAYVNALAHRRGLSVTAESAGTAAASKINPLAAEALREDGVSLEGHAPKRIDQAMIARADKIISMGCGVDAANCPARFVVTEDWGLDDPAGQPIEAVRAIRDQVKARVEELLLMAGQK
ncbi:MAG: arsenate reductase ArsC [Fimbriimonadaceae bacterium]